jgi:hypothetical protein
MPRKAGSTNPTGGSGGGGVQSTSACTDNESLTPRSFDSKPSRFNGVGNASIIRTDINNSAPIEPQIAKANRYMN